MILASEFVVLKDDFVTESKNKHSRIRKVT